MHRLISYKPLVTLMVLWVLCLGGSLATALSSEGGFQSKNAGTQLPVMKAMI